MSSSSFFKRNLTVSLLLLVGCLTLNFESAFGRQHLNLTFDSVYQALPDLKGKAKFSYYLDKKDHPIKDGEFQFSQPERDSSCQNIFNQHQWNGNFKEGRKVGLWEYLKHSHQVKIINADYGNANYEVASQRSEVSGGYQDGFPEGNWQYQLANYEGKKVVNQPKLGKIVFYEGQANGTLQFLQKDAETGDTLIYISGEAQKGLMEGTWQFLYPNKGNGALVNEKRSYRKGILLELTKTIAKDTLVKLSFPLSKTLKAFAKGENSYKGELVNRPLSLSFNDGYPRNSDWVTSQKNGNKILQDFLNNFSYYHAEILALKGLIVGTNRGFYPLRADEKRASEDWIAYNYSLKERLQKLKEKNLTFHAYGQDSVLQWIKAWTDVQEAVLEYTTPWIHLIESNETEFYHREGVIVDYAQNLLGADTLKFATETDLVIYRNAKPKKDENRKSHFGFLHYIAENFEQRLQLADSLNQAFDKRVNNLEIQEEIIALEAIIVQQKRSLDSIYKSTPSIRAKSLKSILESAETAFLQEGFSKQMNQFLASYKSPARQKTLSDSLNAELNYLKEIHGTVLELDANLPKIDTIYTEYKFDPFTFSDRVPFRVQKTLYETAIEQIMPSLFSKAQSSTEPKEMLKNLQTADALLERLNQLRDKNTKPLERKLKNMDSPDEQLEIINKFLK